VDIAYLALVGGGLGVYWWRHLRAQRGRDVVRELFDTDAEVALHVAQHEARTRGQAISSLHMLYGLLQVEGVTAAIERAGGDAGALEDRVLAALDGVAAAPAGRFTEEAQRMLAPAAYIAPQHGRRATCTDFWAYLGGSDAAALLDSSEVTRHSVLFVLCHGAPEPALPAASAGDVDVVIRNDDYTTQELVCEILRDVFGLPEAEATDRMLATHTRGRTLVGRFPAADARTRISAARERTRAHGRCYPLWVGVEPAG
jgi:ATP-dependent Clp protease adaptor protein ClpS